MKRLIIIFCLLVPVLQGYAVTQAQYFNSTFNGKNINYLVHVPSFHMDAYPLLVFLHGVGEKAQHEEGAHPYDINLLKKHGPAKLIDQGFWPQDFPFIVISIQCFKGCRYHQPEIVKEVIERARNTYSIDNKRIYLTGISMGGNGVMRFLAAYPNMVAAAVPIAGWGAGNWCAFNNTAYWGLHNRGDEIVNVQGTLEAYQKLKACTNRKAKAQITIFPVAGHDAWTKVYEHFGQENIYQFLLNQSLP